MGRLRFVGATHQGVQRGEAPSALLLFPKIGGQRVDDTMTMQQNAAGVWGVPRSSILPPRLGYRG